MHHAKADIKFCIDTVQELYNRAHIVIRYDLYRTGGGCNTDICGFIKLKLTTKPFCACRYNTLNRLYDRPCHNFGFFAK